MQTDLGFWDQFDLGPDKLQPTKEHKNNLLHCCQLFQSSSMLFDSYA